MKIVKILGGLGNQMFQYALLVALRETFDEEVLMDASTFDTYKLHNGFELQRVFQTTARLATEGEVKKLSRFTTNYKLSRIYRKLLPNKRTEKIERRFGDYDPSVLTDNRDLYYEGYWQCPLYFDAYRDKILGEFRLRKPLDERNKLQVEDISKAVTVSIHVRRGDYLKHKLYRGLCGEEYYARAVNYVFERYGRDVNFAIFSNDMPWCVEHILPMLSGCQTTMVDWNHGVDSYKDMYLMSHCMVNVIANSSFSWWAAYLNTHEDKEVIAPKVWINAPLEQEVQMPEWRLM